MSDIPEGIQLTPFDPESPEHPRDGAGAGAGGAGQEGEEEEMVASPLRQRSSRGGDLPTTPGSISKLGGVGGDERNTFYHHLNVR